MCRRRLTHTLSSSSEKSDPQGMSARAGALDWHSEESGKQQSARLLHGTDVLLFELVACSEHWRPLGECRVCADTEVVRHTVNTISSSSTHATVLPHCRPGACNERHSVGRRWQVRRGAAAQWQVSQDISLASQQKGALSAVSSGLGLALRSGAPLRAHSVSDCSPRPRAWMVIRRSARRAHALSLMCSRVPAMQVCPRCCLRFAQIPSARGIYAIAAPPSELLRASLAEQHAQAPRGAKPQAASTPEHCCAACTGILQFEHSFASTAGPAARSRLLDTLDDSQPSRWQPAASLDALPGVVTAEGHRAVTSLSVNIIEPGLTALRAVALWRQLQSELPSEAELSTPAIVTARVSVKDVVKAVKAPAVAAALGCALGEGDVTLAVAFPHPQEALRTEWLRPQGVKRKRGHSYAKGFTWGGTAAVLKAALAANPGTTA